MRCNHQGRRGFSAGGPRSNNANARRDAMPVVKNIFGASAAALAVALASAPALAWEPSKPVEIVVAAGAGGASDPMARMMQAALQTNNLLNQTTPGSP